MCCTNISPLLRAAILSFSVIRQVESGEVGSALDSDAWLDNCTSPRSRSVRLLMVWWQRCLQATLDFDNVWSVAAFVCDRVRWPFHWIVLQRLHKQWGHHCVSVLNHEHVGCIQSIRVVTYQTCHNFVGGIHIFKAKICINPYQSPMHRCITTLCTWFASRCSLQNKSRYWVIK